MNYRSNYGNSYDYNYGQNNLGYSNVSRGLNKLTPKSIIHKHLDGVE